MSFWKSRFSVLTKALSKIDPLAVLLWLGTGLGWLCSQIRNAYIIEREVDQYLDSRIKAAEKELEDKNSSNETEES